MVCRRRVRRLCPRRDPHGAYEEFTRYVVLELQRRGLYHKEYKARRCGRILVCPVIDKIENLSCFGLRLCIALRRTGRVALNRMGARVFLAF